MTTRLILPTPTASDLQWREYKGYIAACGDYAECEVCGSRAIAIVVVDICPTMPYNELHEQQNRKTQLTTNARTEDYPRNADDHLPSKEHGRGNRHSDRGRGQAEEPDRKEVTHRQTAQAFKAPMQS